MFHHILWVSTLVAAGCMSDPAGEPPPRGPMQINYDLRTYEDPAGMRAVSPERLPRTDELPMGAVGFVPLTGSKGAVLVKISESNYEWERTSSSLLIVGAFMNGARIIEEEESKDSYFVARSLYPGASEITYGSATSLFVGAALMAIDQPSFASTVSSSRRNSVAHPEVEGLDARQVLLLVAFQLPEAADRLQLLVSWLGDERDQYSFDEGIARLPSTDDSWAAIPWIASSNESSLSYFVKDVQWTLWHAPEGSRSSQVRGSWAVENDEGGVRLNGSLSYQLNVSAPGPGWFETFFTWEPESSQGSWCVALEPSDSVSPRCKEFDLTRATREQTPWYFLVEPEAQPARALYEIHANASQGAIWQTMYAFYAGIDVSASAGLSLAGYEEFGHRP